MNRGLIIFLVCIIFSCGNRNNDDLNSLKKTNDSLELELTKALDKLHVLESRANKGKDEGYNNEGFDSFFWDFMTDSTFQANRIKFPLPFITWKDEIGGEVDTFKIKQNNWKYDSFYIDIASERTQVYDNFNLKLGPTNQRLLHWYGVETGGDIKYYFEGFDGKWYLTKKVQLGD